LFGRGRGWFWFWFVATVAFHFLDAIYTLKQLPQEVFIGLAAALPVVEFFG
jgi:hypothetical protein